MPVCVDIDALAVVIGASATRSDADTPVAVATGGGTGGAGALAEQHLQRETGALYVAMCEASTPVSFCAFGTSCCSRSARAGSRQTKSSVGSVSPLRASLGPCRDGGTLSAEIGSRLGSRTLRNGCVSIVSSVARSL